MFAREGADISIAYLKEEQKESVSYPLTLGQREARAETFIGADRRPLTTFPLSRSPAPTRSRRRSSPLLSPRAERST